MKKHRTIFAFLVITFIFASEMVFAKAILQGVETFDQNNKFVTELTFDQPISKDKVTVEFINQTVQFNVSGAEAVERKHSKISNHERLKSIFTYQTKDGFLRTRLIHKKKFLASDFKGHVSWETKGNTLRLSLLNPTTTLPAKEVPAQVEKITPRVVVKPNDLSSDLEKALSTKIKVTAGKVKTVTQSITTDISDKPESEIPVFAEKKGAEEKKATTDTYGRLMYSLIIIALFGMGTFVFTKWWGGKTKKTVGGTKIRVVTQHHLGPKKSLTIVRVAGEHILLGVTDSNITMLKSLSLMDDEIPLDTPNSFSKSLSKKMNSEELDEEEEFAIGKIKDLVSSKLNNMRSI